MIVLKILYLLIAVVFFGWTVTVSLGVGMWLYLLYWLFAVGTAVIGILALVKRKKALKVTFYLFASVPITIGIFLIIASILSVLWMYLSVLFRLFFHH